MANPTTAPTLHPMKTACKVAGISYETLKYYCNRGLVPHVKRNSSNHRVFDDNDIAWVKSLICLRKCGMSIAQMKEYLDLCLQGPGSIVERKRILADKRKALEAQIAELHTSVDYIDRKQTLYDDFLSGKTEYHSNLALH